MLLGTVFTYLCVYLSFSHWPWPLQYKEVLSQDSMCSSSSQSMFQLCPISNSLKPVTASHSSLLQISCFQNIILILHNTTCNFNAGSAFSYYNNLESIQLLYILIICSFLLLNSVSQYRCIIVYLTIHPLKDIEKILVWLLQINVRCYCALLWKGYDSHQKVWVTSFLRTLTTLGVTIDPYLRHSERSEWNFLVHLPNSKWLWTSLHVLTCPCTLSPATNLY